MPNFRGDSQFYTWLYRIAVNTAKNHLVSKSRRPVTADIEIVDTDQLSSNNPYVEESTPESELLGNELQLAIDNALSTLPDDLRTALTLREFDGLSYEDIAVIMECPVGTVRSRIFRARESVDQKVLHLLDKN